MRVSSSRIVIAFHQGVPVGPSFDLKKYLLSQKIQSLLFISHPLTYLPEFYKDSSEFVSFERGKETKMGKAYHWRLPDFLLYVKDVIYTFYWVFLGKKKITLFFGVDPLNAFTGILLKRIGVVEKVVYYSIDYFSKRFENKMLNKIYHTIDRFCVMNADETWNLSAQMRSARHKNGVRDNKKQYTVPIGVWLDAQKAVPFSMVKKKKIVFIGTFVKMMGIDLIIRSFPEIVRQVPGVVLHLIGDGPEMVNIRKLVSISKNKENIKLHGWISDPKELKSLLSDGAVGLAPFNTTILSDEIKNADPAKLKDYMVWGMPVVVTKAISNYKEIEKTQCGIVINYNENDLVDAVCMLLKNVKLLQFYRRHALEYIEKFDYNKIYKKNVKRIISSL